MERRRNFKLGENALKAYSNILVKSEKLDLNALLNCHLSTKHGGAEAQLRFFKGGELELIGVARGTRLPPIKMPPMTKIMTTKPIVSLLSFGILPYNSIISNHINIGNHGGPPFNLNFSQPI